MEHKGICKKYTDCWNSQVIFQPWNINLKLKNKYKQNIQYVYYPRNFKEICEQGTAERKSSSPLGFMYNKDIMHIAQFSIAPQKISETLLIGQPFSSSQYDSGSRLFNQ